MHNGNSYGVIAVERLFARKHFDFLRHKRMSEIEVGFSRAFTSEVVVADDR
jgi:hypothetical protein